VSPVVVVLVALAGALGALLRTEVDRLLARPGRLLPVGILVVNVSGCFLLGLLDGAGVSGDARLLLAGALVGSYTTLSTWVVDLHRLLRAGRLRAAALTLVSTVILGFAALASGLLLGALIG
jgi:fluoride exporter